MSTSYGPRGSAGISGDGYQQRVITCGSGSPEGVVPGDPGAIYHDSAAGSFWHKLTGFAETGWSNDIVATGGYKMSLESATFAGASVASITMVQPVTVLPGATLDYINWRWVAPYAGSILALSTYAELNDNTDVTTFTVMKNGSATALTTTYAATVTGDARATVAKDTIVLAAGDYIEVNVSVAGTGFGHNLYCSASIVVEC